MTTQIEALKRALEDKFSMSDFLNDAPKSWIDEQRREWAKSQAAHRNLVSIKRAIKEALAQPEQEPVAWMSPNKERLEFSRKDTVYGSHTIPLYTTPPQRKPLTDEEYSALAEEYTGADGLDCVDFGRAIARHYGVKE